MSDDFKEELESFFYKIDNDGLEYTVANYRFKSVEQRYQELAQVMDRLFSAMNDASVVIDRIRTDNDL